MAIARLRVAGPPVVPRLLALVGPAADAGVAAAALAALEGIEDRHVVGPALAAAGSADPSIATAALGVLRAWVAHDDGTTVIDAVTAIAVDAARDARVRQAALDALSDLPPDLVQQIRRTAPPIEQAPTPDDPLVVRAWIASEGKGAPLSALHDVIEKARQGERMASGQQEQWRIARGAAHALLAARDSRVALYDLRESFEAARGPLPLDFVAAAVAIGDASCLEPMARAWQAAAGEPWWRDRLAGAAAEIVHRSRVSGRSAIMKRIRAKWPGFL